jgi:hypothetical protein
MLKRMMTEMMRIEAEATVGAIRRKHAEKRTTYFFEARVKTASIASEIPFRLSIIKKRTSSTSQFFSSLRTERQSLADSVPQIHSPRYSCRPSQLILLMGYRAAFRT